MTELNKELYNIFFEKIALISKQHDNSSTLRNKFNIFSILRKSHDEVNLHSQFIHQALKNLEDHNVVKYFLQSIKLKDHTNFENIDVYTDFKKPKIYKESDNIDLLLEIDFEKGKEREKLAIIIENKIYASDQNAQLLRYYHVMKKRGYSDNQIKIYYLTLDRHEPSDYSIQEFNEENKSELIDKNYPTNLQDVYNIAYEKEKEKQDKERESEDKYDEKENVFLISYKKEIINWCDSCISQFATEPTLRETFVQYQLLLQQLTGLIGTEMTNELTNIIMDNDNNLEMALKLFSIKDEIHTELKYKYFEKLYETIKNYNKDQDDNISFIMKDSEFPTDNIKKKNYGFNFKIISSQSDNDLLTGRVENKGGRVYWGLPYWNELNKSDKVITDKVIILCNNEFGGTEETVWIALQPLDQRDDYTLNFNSHTSLAKIIRKEKDLQEYITKHVKNMANNYKEILKAEQE